MADPTCATVWVVGGPEEQWCAQIFAHLAPVADRVTLRLAPSLAEVPEGACAITCNGSGRLAGTLEAAEVLARPPAELLRTAASPPPVTRHEEPLVVSVVSTDAILGAEVALLLAEASSTHLPTTLVEARSRGLQGFLHDLVDPPVTLEALVAGAAALGEADTPFPIGIPLLTRGYRLLPRARDPLGGGIVGFQAATALLGSLGRTLGIVIADCDPPGPGSASTGLIDADELAALPRTLLGASASAVLVGRASLAGRYALVNLVAEVRALLPRETTFSCVLVGTTRRADARALTQLLEDVHPGSTHRLTSLSAIPETELDAVHRSVAPIPASTLGPLRSLAASLARLEPVAAVTPAARVGYPIYEALDALLPEPPRPREAS